MTHWMFSFDVSLQPPATKESARYRGVKAGSWALIVFHNASKTEAKRRFCRRATML